MIEPMLLKKVKELPEQDGCIYEQKYDGGRIVAIVRDGKIKLFTRHGNNVAIQFPEITGILRQYKGNYIFDGEIVVLRQGKCDFEAYLQRVHTTNPFQIKLRMKTIPATYIVFDILQLNDNDLTYNTLMERKQVLNNIKFDEVFTKHTIYYETPHFLLKNRDKIEGIVAKKKNSIYEAGKRSGAWVKYRFIKEEEIEVVNYEETPSGIVAITEKGDRITINGRQAGAVAGVIDMNGKARIEINYYEKSKDNRYRFPAFRRLIK